LTERGQPPAPLPLTSVPPVSLIAISPGYPCAATAGAGSILGRRYLVPLVSHEAQALRLVAGLVVCGLALRPEALRDWGRLLLRTRRHTNHERSVIVGVHGRVGG